MVRPLEPEVKRNERPNKEADDIYDFPTCGVPKRTGPISLNLGRKNILTSGMLFT